MIVYIVMRTEFTSDGSPRALSTGPFGVFSTAEAAQTKARKLGIGYLIVSWSVDGAFIGTLPS